MSIRVGIGYDIHTLTSDRSLVIGGVTIPHDRGLMGHSDADVLLHAIMDAMLGALAMGDIGMIFPDTDPQWKGADSMKLLAHVVDMVKAKGYLVGNVDTVIVAERPKLISYHSQMKKNIASVLHISSDHVGIKATTGERLGFEGREEGISARAVILLIAAEA